MKTHTEDTFEKLIVEHLVLHGGFEPRGQTTYDPDEALTVHAGYDVHRALIPAEVIAFVQATQPKPWAKLQAIHGSALEGIFLDALCKVWMTTRLAKGSIHFLPFNRGHDQLAHRLASPHDEQDRKVYDAVVVLTDRKVLDQQRQKSIYQFEHKTRVVEKIDTNSTQLADAWPPGCPSSSPPSTSSSSSRTRSRPYRTAATPSSWTRPTPPKPARWPSRSRSCSRTAASPPSWRRRARTSPLRTSAPYAPLCSVVPKST